MSERQRDEINTAAERAGDDRGDYIRRALAYAVTHMPPDWHSQGDDTGQTMITGVITASASDRATELTTWDASRTYENSHSPAAVLPTDSYTCCQCNRMSTFTLISDKCRDCHFGPTLRAI